MRNSRIRIKAEVSNYFKDEIIYPGIVQEYENGFDEMILLNKAFAIMLMEEKIVDAGDAKVILEGLTYVKENFTYKDLDGKYEELYFNMEQYLIQRIGVKVGGKLHTGRSRNDIYATLWRMETRKSVWNIMQTIIELQEMFLEKARENIDTVITGYTHMQPAQPVTLGFYYSAALSVLNRDFARLADAYARLNLSPYGAAALAGTGFGINREKLSGLLGFDGVLSNTLDCVGSRDYLLEVETALSIMMISLSRIIQDHYLWCTNEFGILDIGGEVAVCSSIMPQKKNPVSLELAKAKAGHIIGSLVSSLCVLKNTPFSLCMDLFEAHGQYWQGQKEAVHALKLLTETLKYSTFRKELAYDRAKSNFSTVTALADLLVVKFNISFAEAHDIVGSMVGSVIDQDLPIECMDDRLLRKASKEMIGTELEVTQAEITNALEPHANVRSKTSVGSPGKEEVGKMLAEAALELENNKKWLTDRKAQVAAAYKALKKKEDMVVNS